MLCTRITARETYFIADYCVEMAITTESLSAQFYNCKLAINLKFQWSLFVLVVSQIFWKYSMP